MIHLQEVVIKLVLQIVLCNYWWTCIELQFINFHFLLGLLKLCSAEYMYILYFFL